MGQGITKPVFVANMGLRNDVLNKRATLSTQLTDVFKTNAWRTETKGLTFSETMDHTFLSRALFVGFNYRFGNIDKVKNKQPVLGGGGDGA